MQILKKRKMKKLKKIEKNIHALKKYAHFKKMGFTPNFTGKRGKFKIDMNPSMEDVQEMISILKKEHKKIKEKIEGVKIC